MVIAIETFIVLAVTVEALIAYAKSFYEMESPKAVIAQAAGILISVGLCISVGLNIYSSVLGIDFAYPIIGCVLTGIFGSRGANYAHDILNKLQGVKNETDAAYNSEVYITEYDELNDLKSMCDALGIPYTAHATVKSLKAKINAAQKEV